MTSVFPYLVRLCSYILGRSAHVTQPEMIESFNVPKNKVAKWAGITSSVFSLSQALTGISWGRASDRVGRKPIILAGIAGVMLAGLVFGFSQTLAWAIIARAFAGLFSGNVGITRTMVAEMVPQRELQPRAFSIMPLVWLVILEPLHSVLIMITSMFRDHHPLFSASSSFFIIPHRLSSSKLTTRYTQDDWKYLWPCVRRRLSKPSCEVSSSLWGQWLLQDPPVRTPKHGVQCLLPGRSDYRLSVLERNIGDTERPCRLWAKVRKANPTTVCEEEDSCLAA